MEEQTGANVLDVISGKETLKVEHIIGISTGVTYLLLAVGVLAVFRAIIKNKN
jgi:hypothetical protein